MAAYLFGSFVHGKARPTSDVDVAVRLVPGLSAERNFGLRLELMDEMEAYYQSSADIVILNKAALKMIRQLLTHGTLLYAREEETEPFYAVQK